MAKSVPEKLPSTVTAGERLLFQVLRHFLPDDYIVYYEPDIQGVRPDFVLIGPDLGLVVLEVKDYTKNTLHRLNPDQWLIQTSSGLVVQKSPLKQAREYAFRIANLLERDKSLIQLEGKYKYRLKFPYGYGVVMTRLTRKHLYRHDLADVLNPQLCLTRDDIDPQSESFSPTDLLDKIKNMFVASFRHAPLSQRDIRTIRYHLFPEVRISAEYKPVRPLPGSQYALVELDDVKVMDLQQENLAKQIGDKHRLIRGVAGSGKTLILASRAKILAESHPDWHILVLCFNIALARYIDQMIQYKLRENIVEHSEKSAVPPTPNNVRITVRHFHQWLKEIGISKDEQIPDVLKRLEKGEGHFPMYDAVLIDEGQDFSSEWLKLVVKLLNPETMSLLIVEDRAQTVYSRQRNFAQDIGLSFRGRSRVLKKNYRNTAPIIQLAWDFYQTYGLDYHDQEDEVEVIPPESSQRPGDPPIIHKASSLLEEMAWVAKQIERLHDDKRVPYEEIAVLYRYNFSRSYPIVRLLLQHLKQRDIPYYWISESRDTKMNFNKDEAAVKICTIHSSKGLDFKAGFVVGIDSMPFHNQEIGPAQEASLLYIGLTRARDYLFVSYSGDSAFTPYFDRLLQREPVRA
ncbi:3'-5' exonuclease [Polycladomyces subterraneus]|uniref:NERD domain-containing protein n=1 Tax=Polycladomyces subterraneus TaxID=1016997 RepID=A0ABT8IK45_9BACL|nr:nuclease-related domain-containing DEAD/DEAH box helicase [Polycladomyces subterraneus]MDN4592529.1 NERD domain-containing protein [Polycladomyces subterraneus]